MTGSRITTPVYEQFHDSGSFLNNFFGGFGSNQGGDGGAPTLEAIYDPDGDDDSDGVRNMDEEIVVTAGVTHGQIQLLNQAAAWYKWGQSLAFSLVVGKQLIGSSLTHGGQLVAGTAIAGATTVPIVDNGHYQANWNYLYWSQLSANKGYTPQNGTIYNP